MKRLVETNAPEIFVPIGKPELIESQAGQKLLSIKGIFGKVNARNENNRIYPKTVWEKNLCEGSPFRKRLKMRAVLGELEHPESGNTHLERVSHLITDAWTEDLDEAKITKLGLDVDVVKPGCYVLGKYEVLNTPRGGILRALHEANVKVGISSRGRGDVRNINGVDEVADNYELDCWDAVYLPSVLEATPGPMQEAQKKLKEQEEMQDLGSTLPAAAGAPGATTDVTPTDVTPTDVTPTNTAPTNWKPEAEEIVRALEDTIGDEKDIVDMIPILQRGITLVDQLSSVNDEEAVKLKSQALTLIRVLTNEIMKRETGDGPSKKSSPAKSSPAKSSPEKSSSEKPKEEKPKEEKESTEIKEQDLNNLATAVVARRGKDYPMFKGDIETELNRTGHKVDPAAVTELANALRNQGVKVDPTKYEDIKEAIQKNVADGAIVAVDVKKLLKTLEGTGVEENTPKVERYKGMVEFLRKQEGDVLVRVCSKGLKGYVVRLLEPAFGESNIFIKYGGEKPAQVESQELMKEEDMKFKEMLTKLVKENDGLKEKLNGKVEGVPEVRYEAAKKLISALVEKMKNAEKALIHEGKRVQAATKLIHKLVNEKKGQSLEEAPDKKDESKKESVAKKSVVTEDKKVEETKEPVEVDTISKALYTSAMEKARIKAESLKAEPESKKQEDVIETKKKKITTESKDLLKRLRPKKEESKKEAIQESNLMTATVKRIKG